MTVSVRRVVIAYERWLTVKIAILGGLIAITKPLRDLHQWAMMREIDAINRRVGLSIEIELKFRR